MAELRRMRPLLGTFVEVGIADANKRASEAISMAFAAIESVQRSMSFHDSESELSLLNASQGQRLKLSPMLWRLLRLSKELSEKSDGRFNCFVGADLVRRGLLPGPSGSQESAFRHGNANDLELFSDSSAALKSGVQITLDGIAKGYAVDLAVKSLRQHGVASGWINAGGDMRAFGQLAVPVYQESVEGERQPIGLIRNAAVATSFVLEKPNSRTPAWIVLPEGAARSNATHTVIAPQAWLADALAKVACCCESLEFRQSLISSLGGLYFQRPCPSVAA